jgi:Peptidase family C25
MSIPRLDRRRTFPLFMVLAAFVFALAAFRQAAAPRALLIVAPQALQPALAEYVAYKKTILPVESATLESILASMHGVDDPEKVKRYIYNAWRQRHVGYVLLVGDRDTMPLRYMTSLKFATFDYLFQPTDLYYADLAKNDGSFNDWNADTSEYHAGYFGEVNGERGRPMNLDGIRYQPEVAVGRWPVSTPDAIAIVAAKSMAYERSVRDGRHPGLRTAAFFHVQGWVDAREQLTRLARTLPPGWSGHRFLFDDGNAAYRTAAPTEAAVDGTFNQGAGLIVHVGHGETDSWIGYPLTYTVDGKKKVSEVLSTRTLAPIHNADRLPVVISVGCSTAYFAPLGPGEAYIDTSGRAHAGEGHKEIVTGAPPPPSPYQPGELGKDSLGKQLLEDGPNGAVAYIGSDMVAQPMALTLLDGFMNALRTSRDPRVGDNWTAAVRHYYEAAGLAHLEPDGDWVKPATFAQAMKFNLFGDPSLPMAGPKQ